MSGHCPNCGNTICLCRDDRLTCSSCGATGIGIGFVHDCDPFDARRERARIASWLRALPHAVSPTVVADLIERGEHLRPREG